MDHNITVPITVPLDDQLQSWFPLPYSRTFIKMFAIYMSLCTHIISGPTWCCLRNTGRVDIRTHFDPSCGNMEIFLILWICFSYLWSGATILPTQVIKRHHRNWEHMKPCEEGVTHIKCSVNVSSPLNILFNNFYFPFYVILLFVCLFWEYKLVIWICRVNQRGSEYNEVLGRGGRDVRK